MRQPRPRLRSTWTVTTLLTFGLVAAVSAEPTPPPADAADDPATPVQVRDEIVVTASHVPTDRDAAGASVTVIDREAIERSGAPTVLELLRGVPGLEVVQGGGDGRVASLFLRGGGSAQTLVLLDGVRLNGPAAGAADLADLSTLHVERIEVLRGPQSGLYGSEAMAGVVAIYTRPGGGDPAGTLLAEGGSAGWRRGRASLTGGAGRLRYALGVERTDTDGVSAAAEDAGNPEDDGWDHGSVAGRAAWDFAGGGRTDVAFRLVDAEAELDGFGFDGTAFVPMDDPNYVQHRDARVVSLHVERPVTSRWTQVVTAGLHDEELEGRDPDTFFHPFVFDSRVRHAGTRADLALAGDAALSVGVGWEERAMLDEGLFDEEVTLGSAYAELRREWTDVAGLARLAASASVRHDDHSTFGGETTWRATAAARRGATRLHAAWGTGFRAPTFFDLFSPFGSNPGLAPETSSGGDLGVERSFAGGRGRVDVTLFHTDFEDLIVLDATFTPQNLARARARGVEASLAAELAPRLSLDASYTYTDGEDRTTGEPLPRRPEHRAAVALDLEATPRLTGRLAAHAARGRVDTGGVPMDDYVRVDLHLRFAATPRLAPFLRVENLLDADYEELRGFTSPGVEGFVGLAASF